MWQLGSNTPNFTLEGHEKGVNCLDYYSGGDKPYLISGADDHLIKIWDYQVRRTATGGSIPGHSLDHLHPFVLHFTVMKSVFVCVSVHQNKTCVQTLEGHTQNVTCVTFHPELPIILTGSEDGTMWTLMTNTGNLLPRRILSQFGLVAVSLGTVRVWHSNTYRLENTLNYGMERVWCITGQPGSNNVAIGYDDGSIIIKVHSIIVFYSNLA